MIVAVILRRRASGVAAFWKEAKLLLHICYTRESYLLKWVSAFSVKVIHELAKLATSIRAKTVQMPTVRQALCVGFTTTNLNNFFIGQGLHPGRVGLIRLVFVVFREIAYFIETKLAKTCFTPCIDKAFFGQCHAMRITTSELNDNLILEGLNFFRYWHERTPVDVKWHLQNITEPELSTWSASETVYFTTFC